MNHLDFPTEQASQTGEYPDFNLMSLNGKAIAPEELQQHQAQEAARWRRVVETILIEDEIRNTLRNR